MVSLAGWPLTPHSASQPWGSCGALLPQPPHHEGESSDDKLEGSQRWGGNVADQTEGENSGADASAEQHRQRSRRTERQQGETDDEHGGPTNGTRLATVARSPRTRANIAAASRVPKTVYAATKKGLARGWNLAGTPNATWARA